MEPLTKQEIENIRQSYRKYKSLRKVRKYHNRSISTISKYVSDIMANRKNIISSTASKNEILIGTYIGLWLGDGTQYYDNNFTVKICSNKNDEMLNSFIQKLIFSLFGKKSALIKEKNTARAYVKFRSKFIYNFIYDYAEYSGRKAHTVRLKKNINEYSDAFLKGVLLGLMLSDGYLKHRLVFNVTSEQLAKNMADILLRFGFNPSISVTKREQFGWKDLQSVRLNAKESKAANLFLNRIILNIGVRRSFIDLKYGLLADFY